MTEREQLSPLQNELFEKYSYNNYVNNLKSKTFCLTIDDILLVEMETRQQSNNPLWNMLRLDRQTASGNASASRSVPQSAAMSYGLCQEKLVKADTFLMDKIKQVIETILDCSVSDIVKECGMFLSKLGLYSASPDAYFVASGFNDDRETQYIPIEIKCPHTYIDKTFEEVRKELNDRNARYRVKHTALSVNKRGNPLFAVEHTDAHYRQMQRQMYVLNAPLCVYVVKFANSYVVCPVARDHTFCLKERDCERKLFEMFVKRNNDRDLYKRFEQRVRSLQAFSADQARALADSGLYYDFGTLKCILCSTQFDLDTPVSTILTKHDYCGDTSIKKMSKIHNSQYLNHRKRVESLLQHNANAAFAAQGVYHDGACLRTFCCGAEQQATTIKHNDTCKYTLMLSCQ
ncbi:alkaline exonuclease [Agrotis segetum nucleopolyhedrovirus A]|uniref:Alkaline exonuclease n=1 Tax=Agrotis segetum nuclear polyhedrosis virus TaxID=1962501 RepID=Q287N1_NPVAS|nr:alkaline exonuclease [Agrotis segetum nucleopolyhedrovirus A]AAZ38207.1 alkaline exonuclease [Agrotis segetum nucleopolyhedrovirus A]